MTTAEKISIVQTLLENDAAATDALVSVYLSDAEMAILRRLYRVYADMPDGVTLPPIYDFLSCKLAARYFLRRGGEGEIAHNENGVNRTYGSVNDEDLLREVMTYAKVV